MLFQPCENCAIFEHLDPLFFSFFLLARSCAVEIRSSFCLCYPNITGSQDCYRKKDGRHRSIGFPSWEQKLVNMYSYCLQWRNGSAAWGWFVLLTCLFSQKVQPRWRSRPNRSHRSLELAEPLTPLKSHQHVSVTGPSVIQKTYRGQILSILTAPMTNREVGDHL